MSEIDFIKRVPCLHCGRQFDASLEADREKFKRWKVGEVLRCSFKKPRNAGFHRKYFAMLNKAYGMQENYDSFEAFRSDVIMAAGYRDTRTTPWGTVIHEPTSIAFANMNEYTFQRLYDKSIDALLKYFLPKGFDDEYRDILARQILEFA